MATEIELGQAEVVDAIRAVVDEFGYDYVYPPAEAGDACRYEDEFGGCIVGNVVKRIVPEFDFELFEDLDARSVLQGKTRQDTGMSGAYEDDNDPPVRVRTSRQVGEALRAAQTIQDEGGTWGDALEEFDRFLTVDLDTLNVYGDSEDWV